MQDLSNPASGQVNEPDVTDADVNPTADDHSRPEGRAPESLHSLSVEDDPAGTTDPADVANPDGADSESQNTAVDVHAAPEHSDATEQPR